MSPAKKTKSPVKKAASRASADSTRVVKVPSDLNEKFLVIVESPTKARTLNRYLGNSYYIMASGGHIIDLPPKRFGVDIEKGFEPEYELMPGKTNTANALAKAAREAKGVFLATDPDREGEAIAWHISKHIGKRSRQQISRVQFNEITKTAVQAALANPADIDMSKVEAQQARRIMDRIVGYQVSPLLWKTVTRGLSAGRVQSVTLRLICEREVEIGKFVAQEYWTIEGLFQGENIVPFSAKLFQVDGSKVEIANEEEANRLKTRIEASSYTISSVKKSQKKRQPFPPYITSTLQQDAGRRLGFQVKRTMSIAQKLYEGLEVGSRGLTGLITYMRTDSTRIAGEANDSLRNWIVSEFGEKYLSSKTRQFSSKKGNVQDAHEAIRPTDVTLTPDSIKSFLKPEEYKLYDLIWRRFVATQMSSALLDLTSVDISDGTGILFRATGQVIRFPGFLAVYADIQQDNESSDDNENGVSPAGQSGGLPANLNEGVGLDLKQVDPSQHFTQPPPRYTEASLVKELDELGIGRPSTYATIISTLLDRKYLERLKKVLLPTQLGITVNRILVSSFPDIFNVTFTARMEEELDKIETGINRLKVLKDFYGPFRQALENAESNRAELKKDSLELVGEACPDCGSQLVYRWSRNGRFISCSAFPKCKYAASVEKEEPVKTDVKCPECGSDMLLRQGKFGKFFGCSNYPKCRGIKPFTTGHECPVEGCEGHLVERRSKKGRVFYGCENYPKCNFTSWDKPVDGPCPECNAPILFQKNTQQAEPVKYCQKCKWKEKS